MLRLKSMHSTDPWWQAAWDGFVQHKFGSNTANRQSIYNRATYETLGINIGAMWGTPGASHAKDLEGLYDSTRSGDQTPCDCK